MVVVLGHDSCGAVAATREALTDGLGTNGFVRDVIERVTPSVLAARAAGLTSNDDIIDEHIRHTVDLLVDRSRLLSEQPGGPPWSGCPTTCPTATRASSPSAESTRRPVRADHTFEVDLFDNALHAPLPITVNGPYRHAARGRRTRSRAVARPGRSPEPHHQQPTPDEQEPREHAQGNGWQRLHRRTIVGLGQ
nr:MULTISPECIES: carbonic anhydrase [unclassified Amycolatopsis]